MLDTATAASIGPLLRRVRLNDEQSLADVAAALGVPEHTVARYEHGAEFTVTVLVRWCHALDVAPSEVILAASKLGFAYTKQVAPEPSFSDEH